MARGFNSQFAWWYLTREQKEELSRQRSLLYRFGGSGQSRYWPQQEVGMAEVGIKPQYYIKETQASVRAYWGTRVRVEFL